MTAADQPTTEPSEGTDWQETAQVLARAIKTGDMSEVQERLDTLAPAPQPATDTQTEVQWGVRYHEGGKVYDTPMENEEHARSLARIVDATVVHRTVTRTRWEEA